MDFSDTIDSNEKNNGHYHLCQLPHVQRLP